MHDIIIEQNRAATKFFNKARGMLPAFKRFLSGAQCGKGSKPRHPQEADHGYTFEADESDDESDVESNVWFELNFRPHYISLMMFWLRF